MPSANCEECHPEVYVNEIFGIKEAIDMLSICDVQQRDRLTAIEGHAGALYDLSCFIELEGDDLTLSKLLNEIKRLEKKDFVEMGEIKSPDMPMKG